MGPQPPLLEQYYWYSQIALATIAVLSLLIASFAARAAFAQSASLRLFELLKYTQDPDFRSARRTVIREIEQLQGKEWWDDERLENAASTVCAMYDILGRLLEFSGYNAVAKFFVCNWADSIIRTHRILAIFIEHRHKAGGHDYHGYRWLTEKAKKFDPQVGPAWPRPKSN